MGPKWDQNGIKMAIQMRPKWDQTGVPGWSLGILGGPLGLPGGVPWGPNWDPGLMGHQWGTRDPKSAESVKQSSKTGAGTLGPVPAATGFWGPLWDSLKYPIRTL